MAATRGPRRGRTAAATGRAGGKKTSGNKGGKGPAYAEALYDVVCVGQRFGETTSDKKTPFIEILFKPEYQCDPVFPDDASKRTKVTVSYERGATMYLSEGTLKAGICLKQLRAAGWKTKSLADLDPSVPGYCDLTGNRFKARCAHDKKDGKVYEDWSIFTPGGGKKKENKSGLGSKLDALFSDLITASVEDDVPDVDDEPEVDDTVEEEVVEDDSDDADTDDEGDFDDDDDEDGDDDVPF